MAMMAVKIKIMPSSPTTDLEEIRRRAEVIIRESNGKNLQISEEPIAFGLKALILFFAWPEEKTLESLEQKLSKIDNVQSEEVVDMRRAFG